MNIVKIEGLLSRMDTVQWVRPYVARGLINSVAGSYVNTLDRLRRLRGDENNHRLTHDEYSDRVRGLEKSAAQLQGVLAFAGQYLTPEVSVTGADILNWLVVPRVEQPDLTDARVSARAKILRITEAQVRQQLTADAERRTRNNALQARTYEQDRSYFEQAINIALQMHAQDDLHIDEPLAAKLASTISDRLRHYAGTKLSDAETREAKGQTRIALEMYAEVELLVDIAQQADTIAHQFSAEADAITNRAPVEELAAAVA